MEEMMLLGRIMFGGYFLFAGLGHFMKRDDMVSYAAQQGVSAILVSISGILLMLGGATVILGAYVQLGLTVLSLLLVVISFKMHPFWRHQDEQMKGMDMWHFLKNMALLGACLMIAASSINWAYALGLAL